MSSRVAEVAAETLSKHNFASAASAIQKQLELQLRLLLAEHRHSALSVAGQRGAQGEKDQAQRYTVTPATENFGLSTPRPRGQSCPKSGPSSNSHRSWRCWTVRVPTLGLVAAPRPALD